MGKYIDKQQLQELSQLKPLRSLSQIALEWLIIFGIIYTCELVRAEIPLAVTILLYPLVMILMGTRIHALAVLLHDAAHYRIVKHKKMNLIIGGPLLGWPVLTSVFSYSRNHFKHHNHTNTEKDPDWERRSHDEDHDFPMSLSCFLLTCAKYLLGLKVAQEIGMAMKMNLKRKPPIGTTICRVIFYSSIISLAVYYNFLVQLLFYWIIPFFTSFLCIMYIRGVAEHFGSMEYSHELNHSRHTDAHWLEKILIAPNNVNYHLDHHLYPSVPFYNLPKLHEALLKNEEYRENAHITKGYFTGVLEECTREWRKAQEQKNSVGLHV